MAHTLQERYAALIMAKLRKELVLKDGVVFNNDYEGSPTAGSVKIPVRDTEVAASDYDKAKRETYTCRNMPRQNIGSYKAFCLTT